MKELRMNLRFSITYTDFSNDLFYTEDGLEIDDSNYDKLLMDNEIVLIVQNGRRFNSSVKLNKYAFCQTLKKKPLVLLSLVRDLIQNKMFCLKKIECIDLSTLSLIKSN